MALVRPSLPLLSFLRGQRPSTTPLPRMWGAGLLRLSEI